MNINTLSKLIFIMLALPLWGSFRMPEKTTRKDSIQWLTLTEAAEKSKTEPRKVLVDVYTDWCGWCRKMDKSTFSDPKVVAYVNQNFYAVKLNAEGKDPLTINGKTYRFNAQYRTHEAALALLNGQMSYPTTVYLDEKMKIISPVPGYQDVTTFSSVLAYFGENHYLKKSYAEYAALTKSSK